MREPYRVAVTGPGGLGACAIREVSRLAEVRLSAVLADSPSKNGVDAGELAGIGPVGIKATTDFAKFVSSDADCLTYTARDFGDWRADDFWTIGIEGRPSLKVSVESKASFADDTYISPEEPSPRYTSTLVAITQAVPAVIAAAPGLLLPALPQFH